MDAMTDCERHNREAYQTRHRLANPERLTAMTQSRSSEVVIGLQQIYEQLVCLRSTVERLVDHDHDNEDREQRIRALERARWPLPSLSIVLAAASLFFALLYRG